MSVCVCVCVCVREREREKERERERESIITNQFSLRIELFEIHVTLI